MEKWWIRTLSRCAAVDQVAEVAREILEARVGRLDEDVGLVARGAEHALDAQHLVADGVAVAQGGQHLVDSRATGAGAHRRRSARRAGPAGSSRTTSCPARQTARRRANHPGSGSTGARVAPP